MCSCLSEAVLLQGNVLLGKHFFGFDIDGFHLQRKKISAVTGKISQLYDI